ncbi:MAG: class I SAM-dependent methyltransferase [Chloroflexota bacterium]|nr:class I SAM-dependent methyltransferase [Chloroflexota bacterium]
MTERVSVHTDETAARRGNPSFVWRAGQERRLKMFADAARLTDTRVLIDGCGVGMYAAHIRQRYTAHVDAIDIEFERVQDTHAAAVPRAVVAAAETLPYASNTFDAVFSHEVLEHVADDILAAREMARVTKPGGRIVIFAPNRWYPFETHGHYWRGAYHFGNTPLINYLPDALRNRLAPHVKAYTARGLRRLFDGCPVRVVRHTRVYGGYDNLIARLGGAGKLLRAALQGVEGTPLDTFGLSHLLVVEKTSE